MLANNEPFRINETLIMISAVRDVGDINVRISCRWTAAVETLAWAKERKGWVRQIIRSPLPLSAAARAPALQPVRRPPPLPQS